MTRFCCFTTGWIAALAVVLASQEAFAQATPVQISVGETKTLELEGNPSTGYTWVLNKESGSKVVSVDVRGYAPRPVPAGERPRLGAPAPFQVVLTGIAPGQASLTFDYVRAGAPAQGSGRSFAVEVLGEADVPPAGMDEAQEDAAEDPTSDKPAETPGDLFADPNDTEDGGGSGE